MVQTPKLRLSNGKRYCALFDPGASFSCVHPKVATVFRKVHSNTILNAGTADSTGKRPSVYEHVDISYNIGSRNKNRLLIGVLNNSKGACRPRESLAN